MKTRLFQGEIYVKKSPTHGYGVFAGKKFRKGELIEVCYMLVSKGGDKVLEDYYFDANGKYAMFLGYGSIYNHHDEPNADYFINIKKRLVKIKATKTIPKGEEIFVTYGDEWFSSRGRKAKK
jgi:SET domain-containing protein